MTEDAPFLPSLSPVAGKKVHVALERNSCTKATANRFRLLLHTAAELLLHTLRGLAPRAWHDAQFDTLRLAFVKVAARVTELVTRTEVSLPSTYPYKTSNARIADRARALPSRASRRRPRRRLMNDPCWPDRRGRAWVQAH